MRKTPEIIINLTQIFHRLMNKYMLSLEMILIGIPCDENLNVLLKYLLNMN